MKTIKKLFPAALAVLALASCSDDELLNVSADKAQREAGKLYVQVEDLQDGMNDATRAGFVYGTTSTGYTHGQYLVWTEGDKVKIYDDNLNWRTQVWGYDDAATKAYAKKDGFSVFTKIKSVAGQATEEAPTQYTNAYGVVPADLGKFTNEDRSELEFNLSGLEYWEAGRVAVTDVYTDGMLAKAPIPMWGVATSADGSSEMKVKYLTGILKVDIAQLPATTTGNVNVLVIQSKVATTSTIVNLHPAEVTTDFAPESVTKAPELQVEVESGTATTISSSLDCSSTVPADIMVINLGETTAATAGKRCCVAVPIPVAVNTSGEPVEQELAAYLGTAAKTAPKNITLTTTPIGGAAINKTVASGSLYLIQDEISTETDANTPYNLAEQIKTLDAAADRTVNITVKSNITVDDSGADEHGFVIDLSEYALKNDVNVNFAVSAGFVGKANDENTLEIRTKAGSKKLTITVTEGSNKLKAIKVTDKLAGALELQGTITAIEAGSKNLTINAGVTTVNATAETNIDASGKTIATLNIKKGCEKVNLLNGTVTNAAFGATTEAIDANVEIHTEGNGQIGTIAYANVPQSGSDATLDFTKKVIWTSKWDGTSKTNAATNISGVKDISSAIVSASQLANSSNYSSAAARILASEIDLDGKTWTSLSALTNGIDGNISVVPTSSSKTVAAENTEIKNLAGANGLIAKWTPAADQVIKNITFSGAKIAQTATASNIGLLVGEVDNQTAAGAIQNIKLTGTNNIDGKSGVAVTAIGGVIGKITDATNALTLANINVASGTTVSGSKYVGGIVGEIAGKVVFAAMGADGTVKSASTAEVAATDVFNSSAATLNTYKVGSSVYAPNLATKGQFFGGASAVATAGDITIVGNLTDNVTTDESSWAYYIPTTEFEYNPWQITNNYAEIGACGFNTIANAVEVASAFKDITLLTTDGETTPKYATSTKLVPYVGKTADYTRAKAASSYGLGKTLYFSYVNNPLP